jgi:phosphatidylglycerol:prolipoprotein diacylglycerol transferase
MLAIVFPPISPIALDLGVFQIRWYALAYIAGAILALQYIKYLTNQANLVDNKIKKKFFDDLLFYVILGILLGGRLGFVLFYAPSYYALHPWKIIFLWEGGMSFHGGLIGVIISSYFFGLKHNKKLLQITDMLAPAMPIGLFLGRIANFINAELYGIPTDLPWAVKFPNVLFPRHPSQIYEAFLEGLILFIVLYIMWNKKQYTKVGRISGYTLFLYGIFRFFVEFVREGEIYFFNIISMGQLLCLPMIFAGSYFIYKSYVDKK